MGTVSDKLAYLSQTKGKIKDMINYSGEKITSETTFRDYSKILFKNYLDILIDKGEALFENLPHVENDSASDYVTLENTAKAPMTIETIPQTSQETTTGKNLANINIIGRVPSVSTGQLVTLVNGATTDLIMIDNAKNYTISYVLETTGSSYVFFYDENESYLGNNNIQSGYNLSSSQYFSSSKYLRLRFDSYANFSNIQLEEGSTATSYEPYTNGASPNPDYPQDIHCTTGEQTVKIIGKNLFDKNTSVIKNDYIKDDNGNEISSTISGYTITYTSVKPNTIFTIQGSLISDTTAFRIYYYDKAKKWISRSNGFNIVPMTFTTPNNCYYIQIQYNRSAYNAETIQLEEGSTATSYEPYEETTYSISLGNIGMYNINNIADGFVYDENVDKYYINRKIGKIVLNGSENWSLDSTQKVAGTLVNNLKQITNVSTKGNGLSNYYIIGSLSTARSNINQFAFYYNGASNLWLNCQNMALDDFKNWLSTHNATVIYELAESTLEELTDTTLISQLRAIKNALSMQETTHVISTSSGTNLPFLIKARAVQNISNS